MIYYKIRKLSFLNRCILCFVAVAFLFTSILPPSYAQTPDFLTVNNILSVSNLANNFSPLPVGIEFDPQNPLHLTLNIFDPENKLTRENAEQFTRFFLAAVTVPADSLWVNLSPYEPTRIMPEQLSGTDIGEALLFEDYFLKYLTSSFTHPATSLGKKFWERIYEEASSRGFSSNFSPEILNKVWIVPDKADVAFDGSRALIKNSFLKVLTETDYVALKKEKTSISDDGLSTEDTEQLLREVIIPDLEAAVNFSEDFALLRQLYHSVILAVWYKKKMQSMSLDNDGSMFPYQNSAYRYIKDYINRNKMAGIDIREPSVGKRIWEAYDSDYTKGIYDFIKEDYDANSQEIVPHRYFSGGCSLARTEKILREHGGGIVAEAIQQKKVDIFLQPRTDKEKKSIAERLKTAIDKTPAGDIRGKNDLLKKYRELFFDSEGSPTSYASNMERYFPVFEAIVKDGRHNPIAVEFHVSGDCQLNCQYCIYGEKRKEHDDWGLKPEEIERFIDDIISYNKKTKTPFTDVKFGGIFNDPLSARGKAATVAGLRKAIDNKFWVGITTNGVGLDENVIEILVGDSEKSAKLLNFSLDAGDWHTYKKLKLLGKSDSSAERIFQKVIQNINKSVSLRDKTLSSLRIGISYVLQDGNSAEEELAAVVGIAVEAGVDHITFRMPHTKSEGAPKEEAVGEIYQNILELKQKHADSKTRINFTSEEQEAKAELGGLVNGESQEKSYKRCRAPFVRMTVGGDGKVYLCEHRAYKGGGAYAHISDGFENIVNSAERKNIVDSVRPLEDQKCKFCALHNHLTNEIIDGLARDFEKYPQLFEWLKYEFGFLDQRNSRRLELTKEIAEALTVIRNNKQTHAYQEDISGFENFLEQISTNDMELSSFNSFFASQKDVGTRQGRTTEEHLRLVEQLVTGKKPFERDNSYQQYRVGDNYDVRQCILEMFSDDVFLEKLNLFSVGKDGYSEINLLDQEHLVDVAVNYIRTFLSAHSSNENLKLIAEDCIHEFFGLLQNIQHLSYKYTSVDLKEKIKRYLPYYIVFSLDSILTKLDGKYPEVMGEYFPRLERDHFYRYFTDVLVLSLFGQIDQLRSTRYDFYQRQLFLTMDIFGQELGAYVKREDLGAKFLPVFFLTDAEPLAYPLLSGQISVESGRPAFLYLNRQSFMTPEELSEYRQRGLVNESEHAQIEYIKTTKIFSFLQGNADAGTKSFVESVARKARVRSEEWVLKELGEYGGDNGHSVDWENLKTQYTKNAETIFYLEAAKGILEFMRSDGEVENVMQYIAEKVLPENLLIKNNKSVFIDSGIKGSMAIIAASLVNIAAVSGKTYAEKVLNIENILQDIESVEKTELPGHVFLYGTIRDIADIVPNAGFGRYGHGGANSFIELLPKFSAFGGLDGKGIPIIKDSNSISLYEASIIAQGYRDLVSRKNLIAHASDYEDILDIMNQRIKDDEKPVVAFIDLDNVVFRPTGYVGSEKWFGDSYGEIPTWNSKEKGRFFDLNLDHEKRLYRNGLFETILDVDLLKRELKSRYPGRKILFVGFSARRKTQETETRNILSHLGQYNAFDYFDYSTQMGEGKYDRLFTFLKQNSLDIERSHVLFVDDAVHNIVPFLRNTDVSVVLYTGAESNYSNKTGLEFFQEAQSELKTDKDLAIDRYINALSAQNIPFDKTLIDGMIKLNMIDEDFVHDFLTLTDASQNYLGVSEIEKIQAIFRLVDSQDWPAEILARIQDEFGENSFLHQFSEKLFDQAMLASRHDQEVAYVGKIVQGAKAKYFKNKEYLEGLGISIDEFVENHVLEYAFSFERPLEHIDYLTLFIDILSPYFSSEKIKSYFAQGAVFAGQFQWVNVPNRTYGFYYKGKYYCYLPDEGRKLIKASSYQELLIKNINHVLRSELENGYLVDTVVVYPSLYCNVGCKMCLFSSGKEPEQSQKNPELFLSREELVKTIDLINTVPYLKTLVIGGGGEPFLEPEEVFSLIEKTQINQIKIYTSADWGLNKAVEYLGRIEEVMSMRSKKVSVELNLSADEYHSEGITGDQTGVRHLVNVLDAYADGFKTGKFHNMTLHLRSISEDGLVPQNDTLINKVFSNSKYEFREVLREESKQILSCPQIEGLQISVSYNEMMKKNKRSARDFLSDMKNNNAPFFFNHMFINSDGNVALGGYYESVPLGSLADDDENYIRDSLQNNLIAHVLSQEGLSYLYRLADGYMPDFVANPPPAGTQLEMIKNIFTQPKLALHIYLNMLNDMHKNGKISDAVYAKLHPVDLTMDQYISNMDGLASEDILDQEIARKVNWGFSSGSHAGNILGKEKGEVDSRLSHGNIWWDVGDEEQRILIRRRLESVVDLDRIKMFVGEHINKRFGVNANIKGVTVVGGFITNRSTNKFTEDLDLIVLLGNHNILDFVPDRPFDFGNTFDKDKLPALPNKINVWMISEDHFNKDSSDSIIVDVGQNILSGFVLEGQQIQDSPAPVLERLKQAYFFANMIMKMAADRDVVKMLKRRYELRGMLEQLRQIAAASKNDLLQSENIADIDKEQVAYLQEALKKLLPEKVINPLDRQDDIDLTISGEIDQDKPLDLRDFFMQRRRREILEEVSEIRDKLFRSIETIYSSQKGYFDGKPVQGERESIIDIYKANTVSRSLDEHMVIAKKKNQGYSILAGLAEHTRYPSVLREIYLNVTKRDDLFSEQKTQLFKILSLNPALSYELQKELYVKFQKDGVFLVNFASNIALHKDIRDALKSHQNNNVAKAAQKGEHFVATVNDMILPDYLTGTYDQRENLFRYLVHENYMDSEGAELVGSERSLGGVEDIVKKAVVSYVLKEEQLGQLYDRYKELYNEFLVDYRGNLSDPLVNRNLFVSQMQKLATLVCERILNLDNFSDTPLYQDLSISSFYQLINDVVRNLIDIENVDFLADAKKFLPRPVKVGIVTQEAMRGCSLFNSLFVMSTEAYLKHEIPSWLIEVEHISRQFTSDEEIAGKRFDVLGVEVLQEEPASLQILDTFIGNVPLSDISSEVVVYGSIFTLDGAVEAVNKIIANRIKEPVLIAGEPEPGFLGVVYHELFNAPTGEINNRIVFDGDGKFSIPIVSAAYLTRIDHQVPQNLEEILEDPLSNYYIETSRGCKWNCKFCVDKKLFFKGWRHYPIENIVSIFKETQSFGIKQVFIFDKDFWNGDYEYAREFAQALIDVNNKVRFSVAMRAEEIVKGEELIDLYKRAGLQFVFLGIESFVGGPLERFHKGISPDINLKALEILRKHDVAFGFGYMLDPLYSFDEFLQSLEIMGEHELWRNSTKFFGEVILKAGVEYIEDVRGLGLLGDYDPTTLSYGVKYKDPKIAKLVQVVKRYLKNCPTVNFALLPAMRAVPETLKEKQEHDKYLVLYQQLQKANFDFLKELAYAIRDGVSEDLLEAIADRHGDILHGVLRNILISLDQEYDVSRNLHDYIAMRLGIGKDGGDATGKDGGSGEKDSAMIADVGGIDFSSLYDEDSLSLTDNLYVPVNNFAGFVFDIKIHD